MFIFVGFFVIFPPIRGDAIQSIDSIQQSRTRDFAYTHSLARVPQQHIILTTNIFYLYVLGFTASGAHRKKFCGISFLYGTLQGVPVVRLHLAFFILTIFSTL